MRLAPLLTLLLATAPLAQTAPTPGTCATGAAEAILRPGRVEAAVFNTGALFFGNDRTAANGYLVPRSSGLSPIFAASLWLVGSVGGELRGSSPTYSQFSYWPGPLGDGGTAPAACSAYDRIYHVSRQDIADFLRTGIATDDLRDWPVGLGAPVLDGDGVAGNYNLAGGDQPALRGDDAAWWLMNDVGNVHRGRAATDPLGVEVRVEAAAFATPPLTETTFYRYTVTNRTVQTIDSVYAALFVDADVGTSVDDYVGSDSLSGLAYTYNADDFDGFPDQPSRSTYGAAPPAIGVQVALGPVGLPNGRDDDRDGLVDEPGERMGATAAPMIAKTPTALEVPQTVRGLAWKLQGLANDGSPIREYGTGYDQTQGRVTRYMYPGDPVTGQAWSEFNNGSPNRTNSPGYRRMIIATGPFRLAPGASETVVFAVPFARNASNLDSVARLRQLAGGIRNLFSTGDIEPQRVQGGPAPGVPPVSQDVRLSRPRPNPTPGRAVVTYEMPAGTVLRATLHDVLGRELAVLHDGPTVAAAGELVVDGSRLSPGVYRVRVVVPAGEQTLQLVVAR